MLVTITPTDKKATIEYFRKSVLYSKQAPRVPHSVSCQRIQFKSKIPPSVKGPGNCPNTRVISDCIPKATVRSLSATHIKVNLSKGILL